MTISALIPNDLLQHQRRRAQGVPTITVFVGPPNLGLRAWRSWAETVSRPCAIAAEIEPVALLSAWVAAAFGVAQPEARACEWVARASGSSGVAVSEIGRMTRYDLETLRRSLPLDPGGPAATAVFHILSDFTVGVTPDPRRFTRELLGGSVEAKSIAKVVHAVTELYADKLPALLLLPANEEDADWTAARVLEWIAATEPRVPVAIALRVGAYDRLVSRHGDTRPVALLRESVVELRGVTGNQLEQRLRAAGVEPPPAAVDRLTANGLAEEVAEAFVKASQSVQNPTTADAASDFRSVHEEFLFEQLESMPQTVGLFRPNRPLEFRHGHQAAEADLVADSLKIAVEVDGGYYHLNPEQYRRDRRKDWLYQRHGYLVLRFLAEDVVVELESVLNTILEAAALRRASIQPVGVT